MPCARCAWDVGQLDALRLDLEGAISYGQTLQLPANVTRPPFSIPLPLPNIAGAVTVHAAGLSQGQTVGVGQQDVTVVSGAHSRVTLNLVRGSGSCSDGTLQSNESDVDCGGSCPPCRDFQKCRANADCMSGVCAATTAWWRSARIR